MQPIIGITTNYSSNDEVGIMTHLGGPHQEWHLVANHYIQAVEMAGGIPVIIPIYDHPERAVELLTVLDGIVFTGGNDLDPQHYHETFTVHIGQLCVERDIQELHLARHLINETNLPFLGICRGIQLINVACGGTLFQHIIDPSKPNHFVAGSPIDHPVHHVNIASGSRLEQIYRATLIQTNSYHHQALKTIAPNFSAVGRSVDDIIEAIELKSQRFGLGVQWHPEMMFLRHTEHLAPFQALVEAALRGKK